MRAKDYLIKYSKLNKGKAKDLLKNPKEKYINIGSVNINDLYNANAFNNEHTASNSDNSEYKGVFYD